MKMQRISIKKFVRLLSVMILLFVLTPVGEGFASGTVFDCTNNPEDCEEDSNATITDGSTGTITDDKQSEENPPETNKGITAWEYIKTFLALMFVIGLLYALLKFVNRKNRLFDKSRLMKNLGGISLGQQKSIQLVVVGNSYYLIGVGEDIQLIKEITNEEEIASLVAYYEEMDEIPATGAIHKVMDFMNSRKNRYESSTNQQSTTNDFSNVFNSRLNEMKEERKKRLKEMTEKGRKQDE